MSINNKLRFLHYYIILKRNLLVVIMSYYQIIGNKQPMLCIKTPELRMMKNKQK